MHNVGIHSQEKDYSMFGWLKRKKPSAKAHIKITHKSGETIIVTVEGTNVNHIAHVANRIKEIFNLRTHNTTQEFEQDAKKFWKESENLWKEFDNMMNSMNQIHNDYNEKDKYGKR